jgi:uncharacterized protein YgbK (DUF1537 family)
MRDGAALMGFYGLAGSLHDAVALAAAFGPGARLGFGAGEAGQSDILAPSGATFTQADIAAAARLGRAQYFLSFGNFGLGDLPVMAGAIEYLAAATGVGCMALCLASPEQGRTLYQGHLFEGAKFRIDLIREFAMMMQGGVALIPREIVAAGAAAIAQQFGRLKEQGKMLVLIDAIDDDDCVAVAAAMAGVTLAGGVAGFAGTGGGFAEDDATGPVAILSGALDRQTIFQLGAARASLPVFDLHFEADFGAGDLAGAALGWAAAQTSNAFIITSSVPPDRLTKDAKAAAVLAAIAQGLAKAGVKRFIVAGGETGLAVRTALGMTALRAVGQTGPLLWLQNDSLSISFKTPGSGAKNLFLSEFEPHLRLNNIAELAT